MQGILVVDDDDDTREALAELLRDAGYVVWTATSGGQALIRLGEIHPDLLLVDFIMPDIDGSQLLWRVRRTAEFARLPAILMTAWPRPVDLPEGVCILRKPFDWESLFRLVCKQCAKDSARSTYRCESLDATPVPAVQ